MSVITLTTDFGSSASDAGVLSGVIWKTDPEARIVELTHDIPPQDILAAQIILENAAPFFPEGTVHMVVVDPGVGTERRPIAARLGPHFFVGPDNGLVTPLLERAEANRWTIEVYHLNRPEYWLPEISSIFHGRDIFAPVAAHLAHGTPPSALGERINNPIRASVPVPELLDDGWRGQVVQIDHFGNLSVNIKRGHLEGLGPVEVRVGGQTVEGLSRTFGESQPGDLVALIDSSDRLSISVVNGSAAERLKARSGSPVEVHRRGGQSA